MKLRWSIIVIGLGLLMALGMAKCSHAQTVSAPAATSNQVQLSWTASVSCTTATPCTYIPYRIAGACPATVAGSAGWTQLPATASQAVTALDPTVVSGTQYSYFIEAVLTSDGANSAPSNCVTVTVPLVPAAPTGLSAAG